MEEDEEGARIRSEARADEQEECKQQGGAEQGRNNVEHRKHLGRRRASASES